MPRTRKTDWYVVQVTSGQERRMCELIEATCAEANEQASGDGDRLVLDECFSPRFIAQRKRRTGWTDTEHSFLPGYMIAVVDDPAGLARVLRAIPEFCRVVPVGKTYVPLDETERSWLEASTGRDDRVIPMSFGYRDDDGVLTVVNGPLKGHEGQIVKVNRAASLAHLEFHVGGKTIKATVGLGVVPRSRFTTE